MLSKGSDKNDNLLLASVAVAAALGGAAVTWALRKQEEQKDGKKYRIPDQLLKSPYRKELQVALDVALICGKNIQDHSDTKGTEAEVSHDDLGIDTKSSAADFVTKIDVLNEEIVTKALRTNFPDDEIIGEEAVGTGGLPPLTTKKTWIIDPIDGTTNFASGLPLACVSIGFCVDKIPVLGVVYAPGTDEVYMAVKGYGSFRNGIRLTQRQHVPLEKAVVLFEFGYPRSAEAVGKMLSAVKQFMERGVRATRQFGTGVIDLCYVATGRLSVVYSGVAGEHWKPWDYCAGLVIATEAGCSMETFNQKPGEPFDMYGDSIICAVSQELLQECREILLKI